MMEDTSLIGWARPWLQFLETGFLHADPHPGNFLALDDGRLCIMDYGMMTEISEDQRMAFVEYMAHLSARQYDRTLDDLVKLGFVPAELGNDPEKRAIVAPVLAETLETLYSTGGGIDVKVCVAQLGLSPSLLLSWSDPSRRCPVPLHASPYPCHSHGLPSALSLLPLPLPGPSSPRSALQPLW